MDKPLCVWYCDVCREPIKDKEQGYVVWHTTDGIDSNNFRVIHQGKCDINRDDSSMSLSSFLGADGREYLLSFFSLGSIAQNTHQGPCCRVMNMDEFVDFFRRMQTPYYEEARKYFHVLEVHEKYYDCYSEAYQEKQLKRIIEIGQTKGD